MSALTLLGAVFPAAASGGGGDPKLSGIRLEGSFSMRGTLTYVDNVYGEHRGEHVRRTWSFFPGCASGACKRVTLKRRRSSQHRLDVVVLKRRGRGFYVGTGRFWIALSCAGTVVKRGGLATETITVRIIATATVGTARLATMLRATYTNPQRTNVTRCPGGIGHDAARYRGRRLTPLPGRPTPDFTDTVDLLTSTVTFTDRSHPGANGPPIVSWSWNFGEPSSPENTSTQRNPTHRYRLPGAYTVKLKVRDRYGQVATYTSQVTA